MQFATAPTRLHDLDTTHQESICSWEYLVHEAGVDDLSDDEIVRRVASTFFASLFMGERYTVPPRVRKLKKIRYCTPSTAA